MEVTGKDGIGGGKEADPDTPVHSEESDSEDDVPLVEIEASGLVVLVQTYSSREWLSTSKVYLETLCRVCMETRCRLGLAIM